MVEVIWHGHACFKLRGMRATMVFDSFKGIGLPEPKADADIVLCSHSHEDHNNAERARLVAANGERIAFMSFGSTALLFAT
jgi:L-ascorbate metabolism protein UlaG (beta-lactamase superfamily)